MNTEIERRWLVIPKFTQYLEAKNISYEKIKQYYFTRLESDTAVRMRVVDDKQVFLTIKSGTGMVRNELEFKIFEGDVAPFSAAFQPLLLAGKIGAVPQQIAKISKNRYQLAVEDGRTKEMWGASLDIFGDRIVSPAILDGQVNSPVCIIEIEFGSEYTAKAFVAPEWFGFEITGMNEYSNQSMAWNGLPDRFTADIKHSYGYSWESLSQADAMALLLKRD